MAHLLLDGSAGTYATSPDSPVLDITGDIDIRVDMAMDVWGGTSQGVIGKRASNPTAAYYTYMSGGNRFSFGIHNTITNTRIEVASDVLAYANGTRKWMRVTLDASTGNCIFYESDDGTSWTQIGTPSYGAGVNIRSTVSELQIGTLLSGSNLLAGEIYRAQIYDGIAGTLVFDGDPSDTSTWDCPDKLFFTDKANSATVTLQGDAALIGECPPEGLLAPIGCEISAPSATCSTSAPSVACSISS